MAISSLFLLLLLISLNYQKGVAIEGGFKNVSEENQNHHTFQLSSLLPSAACKPSSSAKGAEKKATLKVVHKHGPCSQLYEDKSKIPSHEQILRKDQSRVDSIHSKLNRKNSDIKATDSTIIPATHASTVGSSNYVVIIDLGTPSTGLSVIFDTGSDLTWTQCQPCDGSCYKQSEPIFNPSSSKSYTNITCGSTLCDSLVSATGNSLSCASSTCVYGIQYGDSSFSIGYFAKERLLLTSADVIDNFYFGCGHNNQGLYDGSAGILGLGRDKLSLVSQTAAKYKKIFSYCLPSHASSTGFLIFGGSQSRKANFTPLATISGGPSFYGIDFTGISVGGRKLSISPSVFSSAGALIDSGTVITRLPPAAYSALRSTFRQFMSKYPSAPKLSILDTCYDFTNYSTISVPKIAFFFKGGAEVDLHATGIFYVKKSSQVCLAFAGNIDASDVGIFGSVQQQTIEVVYDGAAGKIGFASGGCS